MHHSAWKTTLLTALLAMPTAALLTAQPAPPPPPDAPRAVPAPPEAPEPPPPPPRARRKKIVVESPEQDIVVDGDRILIDGDEFDPERFADLGGFDKHAFAWKTERGRGFIGMKPVEMTPELRQHFGAPKDAGVFVGSVEKDGPAARAGLQVGDIVTRVDGDTIASSRDLVRAIRHRKPGETVEVALLRKGAVKTVKVTVGEREADEVRVGQMGFPGGNWGWNDEDWGRNWTWKTPRPGHPRAALPPDYPQLEQRLQDLEKKLKDLEGRLPSH
jgi:hypothetical protein